MGMVTNPLYFLRHFFPCGFFRKLVRIPLSCSFPHLLVQTSKKMLLPRESVYQKVKCQGGSGYHPTPLISAPIKYMNEIIKVIFIFSGSSYPMKLIGRLYDQTGSGKSKMAASNPEVSISQPIDMIGIQFQRLYLCFEVQLSNRTIKNIAWPNRGIPRWRPPNRNYSYLAW